MGIWGKKEINTGVKRYAVFTACGAVLDLALFFLTERLGTGFWLSTLISSIGFCSAMIIQLVKAKDGSGVKIRPTTCQIIVMLSSILGIDFTCTWLLAKVFLLPLFVSKLVATCFVFLYLLSIQNYYACKRESCGLGRKLCFLAAGFASGIMVLHYYSRNCSFYRVGDCVFLIIFLFFLSTQFFLVFSMWMKNGNAIAPVCFIWIVFWSCSSIVTLYPSGIFAVLFIVLLLCFTYLLIRHPLDKTTVYVLSGVICVLFLYNFVTAAIPAIKLWSQRNKSYEARTQFVIDAEDEHPNIYWFHMDGMMGFDTVESTLGDNQADFRNELTERGFVINPDASLDVGWTTFSIPSMASPSVYDLYICKMLEPLSNKTSNERKRLIGVDHAIYESLNDLELFSSFNQAGYNGYCVLFDIGRGLETIPINYEYGQLGKCGSLANIVSLLAEHTIFHALNDQLSDVILKHSALLPIEERIVDTSFSYVKEESWFQYNYIRHYDKVLASIFEELLTMDSPKVVYLQDMMPHYPFIYDENGVYQFISESHKMDQYLPQHDYAGKVLTGMIDRVIEEDPDAIIIIQGDHGVHAFERSELLEQGFSEEQMLEMNYSTISAVLIPEKYGTLTEPLDPLDITRYLVNHYVGEGNYDYLYYHEEE